MRPDLFDGGKPFVGEPGASGQRDVLLPLVVAAGVPGRAQDHQFRVDPRQRALEQDRTLFELDALGPDGKPVRITMGSYGVGVSRAIGAIAEQTLDDQGLLLLVAACPDGGPLREAANAAFAGRGLDQPDAIPRLREARHRGLVPSDEDLIAAFRHGTTG